MMDTQDVCTPHAVPHLHGFDISIYWLVYMHVTELHVYNMVFKAILCNKHNTACITQMIIWLCESACIYALGSKS